MANSFFDFKQFKIVQKNNLMKITTDACILGAKAEFTNCRNILDIGAGTGLLTLFLAQKQNAHFTAVEIDKKGFEELEFNCQNSKWSNMIRCVNQDIKHFAKLKENQLKYDGIISNPPFFNADLKSSIIAQDIAKHEEYTLNMSSFLHSVNLLLAQTGTCYCLYPQRRINEFKSKVFENGLSIKKLTHISNSITKPSHVFIAIIDKNTEDLKTIEENFYIKDGSNYTKEFISFLKPYYLYL